MSQRRPFEPMPITPPRDRLCRVGLPGCKVRSKVWAAMADGRSIPSCEWCAEKVTQQ